MGESEMNEIENKMPCENTEGFVIDNAEKAEWALKKIRDERESRVRAHGWRSSGYMAVVT